MMAHGRDHTNAFGMTDPRRFSSTPMPQTSRCGAAWGTGEAPNGEATNHGESMGIYKVNLLL